MAQQHGHSVLRLPVGHCELNPIEMVWAHVKGFVARNNKTFKMGDVKQFFHKGLQQVSLEQWARDVKHVITEVEVHLRGDYEEFVIYLDSDNSSSEEEPSDEDAN